jgi:hypothetical protein
VIGKARTLPSHGSWLQLLILLGGGAATLSFAIMHYGVWVIPMVAVASVGLVALYRLDWALYAVILLLPFTAIEGDYNAYQVIIQSFKKVVVTALALAWLVHVAVGARVPRIRRWVLLPIVVLGIAAALSILRAPEPVVALSSTGRLITYALVYVVIVSDVLRRPADIWRAVGIMLVAATITAGFALYQLVAHFAGWPTYMNPFYETQYVLPRVHSFMREPLWLSNYLLTILPVALALLCWRTPKWTGLTAITVAASALGLMVTTSRLGWASTLVMGAFFILAAHRFVRLSRLSLVVAGLVVSVVSASAFWLREFGSVQEMSQYVADFATFASPKHGEGDLETHARLVSLIPQAIRTSPLIGVGTNNVGYKLHYAMNLEGPRLSTTHNTYLDAMIETGGIGLIAFLALLVGALTATWRGFRRAGARVEGAVFLGSWLAIVGMAFHLTNWSGWREAHVWFALGFAAACQNAWEHDRSHEA